MKKMKNIFHKNHAAASVIETIIATAIVFAVLLLFFTSIRNLYHVHVREDIDLQVKCNDIIEMFLSSPGRSTTFIKNWEDEIDGSDILAGSLGFAATPTIEYGTFRDDAGDIDTTVLYNEPSAGSLISSCFLLGTQVVTGDETYKNIEDVIVGDIVKSYDLDTDSIVNRKVVDVFHHFPEEMTPYYLVVNDFLKVTPNHLLFHEDHWIYFDDISVGDVINNVVIYSVDKVFEQMPTYNLEIEGDHNYFVCLSNDVLLVHNDDSEMNPWVSTHKDSYVNSIRSFGGDYYVEYTYKDGGTDQGLYEIKSKSNYPYTVIDYDKIMKYQNGEVEYATAKEILGLVSTFNTIYDLYDFHVTITGESGIILDGYGASYKDAQVVVSTTRNVLIYHPPRLGNDFDYVTDDPPDENIIPPYYEIGQIIVRMFF